jgi:simple sugar transport system substrate-binding protein
MFRRSILKLIGGMVALPVTLSTSAFAGDMPAPFDNPGDVKIALVRFLSTGDFFQAYLSGVETQAAALGVDLRVFDSRQDAALQSDMVDQAIALGVDGISNPTWTNRKYARCRSTRSRCRNKGRCV